MVPPHNQRAENLAFWTLGLAEPHSIHTRPRGTIALRQDATGLQIQMPGQKAAAGEIGIMRGCLPLSAVLSFSAWDELLRSTQPRNVEP